MEKYDVVVIGAGPAGYVAAIRCAQLGKKTACVDQWINKSGNYALGGTCLNVGCIPSKALLESSEEYHHAKYDLGAHGIKADNVELDVGTMIQRKDRIVDTLTRGIEGLFKKNKITWLQGKGRLLAHGRVEITPVKEGEAQTVEADNIIIATGSSPRGLPNVPIDGERIVDSSGALEFTEVPKRLGIIGAGVIGVELGSVWKRLGAEVVLLEAMDDFLFFTDDQIAREAKKEFERQGLDIRLGARVLSAAVNDGEIRVNYQDGEGTHDLTFDRLVVAVGRTPNSDELNIKEIGLETDESGFIHVDDQCATSVPGVYAIGDVVRGPMLAHKGSEEGVMVAEIIAGENAHLNYRTIPWVIYTDPEIAWVGSTEKELKAAATEYKTGIFPLTANGRARAMENTTGLIKVIADARTDELLGVHIFGATASEMIAEAVVAMEFSASAEDLARTVHAHPTISEAIHEAALAVDKRALHI